MATSKVTHTYAEIADSMTALTRVTHTYAEIADSMTALTRVTHTYAEIADVSTARVKAVQVYAEIADCTAFPEPENPIPPIGNPDLPINPTDPDYPGQGNVGFNHWTMW